MGKKKRDGEKRKRIHPLLAVPVPLSPLKGFAVLRGFVRDAVQVLFGHS
jgi:hypothetical protein